MESLRGGEPERQVQELLLEEEIRNEVFTLRSEVVWGTQLSINTVKCYHEKGIDLLDGIL